MDLALCGGVPTFVQTMDAIMDETVVEFYTLAEEIDRYNPELWSYIQNKLDGVACEKVPHVQLKQMAKGVKFVVRTGEFTPYPNIILRAGVSFEVKEV